MTWLDDFWGIKKSKPTVQTDPFKPIKLHFNLDSDKDGVKDRFDCQPFNPWKQDTELDIFKKRLQENLKRLDIIKVIKGYGIYKKNGFFNAVDMSTGLTILNNRESLSEITREIQKGIPEKMRKDPRYADSFSVEKTFEGINSSIQYKSKYGNKAKRFSSPTGLVLDIGAGDNPDIRATHAIDLRKPQLNHNIDYKYGYNFNKESTNLPYPSNYFDVVVSYGAYGRNFLSKNIAKEIYRVLKPGGHFECNPDKGVKILSQVGFKIHKDSYYDELLHQNISIVRAIK